MIEKRTVYAVTSGSYSDYQVVQLFEDRADAEAVAARTGDDVEEFDLYPQGSDQVISSRRRYYATVWVRPDGTIWEESFFVHDSWVDQDVEPGLTTVDRGNPHASSSGAFRVQSQADDRDTVVKAVRERAAQVSALILDGVDPSAVEVAR